MEKTEDRKNYNQFFFNNLSAKEYFNAGVIEDEKLASPVNIKKYATLASYCASLSNTTGGCKAY